MATEERKAEPVSEVQGVAYMMVKNGERAGDTLLWVVRKVTFDGKKTASELVTSIPPGPRVIIRDRLRILNESFEVAR